MNYEDEDYLDGDLEVSRDTQLAKLFDEDLKKTLGTSFGRAVLHRLIFAPSFGNLDGASAVENPLHMAFASGKKSVALKLLQELRRIDKSLVRLAEDEHDARLQAWKGM